MRLTLHTFLTLDGVMQAPGGPGEAPDWEHGGWSHPYDDKDFETAMADWFANADAFLLGRTTYEIFSRHWPQVTDADDPIASKLNALPKFVASTTLDSVEWHNSSSPAGSSSPPQRWARDASVGSDDHPRRHQVPLMRGERTSCSR